MKYKKITAIIRTSLLGEVEKQLKQIGVKGMTAFYVMGYGEYANFFEADPQKLTRHVKVEIWARENEVAKIVRAIMDTAHTGTPGDGMVTVLPVESVWRIRTKQGPTKDEI